MKSREELENDLNMLMDTELLYEKEGKDTTNISKKINSIQKELEELIKSK